MVNCWIRSEMFLIVLATFLLGCVLSNEEWYFTGLNVALNKVTTQSPGTAYKGVSQYAVDGGRDADFFQESCTYTLPVLNASASWSVDLDGRYMIKGIRLYNRDVAPERLDNFQIIGYPSKTTLYDDSIVPNKLARQLIISIPVNPTMAFSNITIKIPAIFGYSRLTLCEVEVYADIKCKAPSIVTNGHYIRASNTDYSYGDSLVWTCQDGFKSDQNKTRQCISTSEWSGAEPKCSLITCAFPVNLYNVSLTFANGSIYKTGSAPSKSDISVNCQKGFRTNVTSITCTLDGEWNTLPTCSQIICDNLGILLNGEDGIWSGVVGFCESETGTGPPLFPMAAVGGIISGCIGLAAVVAVISLVYLNRRRNGTSIEKGSITAPTQSTPTEIEENPEYVNLNLETRIEDSYHFDQVHEGAIIEDTTNYEQLSIDGRSENTHNYEPLDIEPHVVDTSNYEPLGVKAKSEDTHNYEPLDIEPYVVDPSNYEPLDVKAKGENTYNYEPLDIEPHVVDTSNYEPLGVKAKSEDTHNYEPLDIEPYVVDPSNYEPIDVKAKGENTYNYEPLDIEPHVVDPSYYEPLDAKAKSENTHNYEPLDIEPHMVDPSNYEPLDVKAKIEDTHNYENLEMHSNI